MNSVSIFKNLEYTQKRKPYPLKFNDKTYYLMFRARSKEIANVYAENLHTCGYRARVIKADTKFGSMRYSIYARK